MTGWRTRLAAVFDGDRDPLYTALIAAGPPLVAVIALLGRRPVTTALAAGYVLAAVAALAVRAAGHDRQ